MDEREHSLQQLCELLQELRADILAFAGHVIDFADKVHRNQVCDLKEVRDLNRNRLNATLRSQGDSSGGGDSGADVGSDASPLGWGYVAAPPGGTDNQGERRSAPYGPAFLPASNQK